MGGQTAKQVQLIRDFADDDSSPPSHALNIADEFVRQGLDPAACVACASAASAPNPWAKACAARSRRGWGIDAMDLYGLSRSSAPCCLRCIEAKDGPVIWEDPFLSRRSFTPKPGKSRPMADPANWVFHRADREALPVVRYRTRDLARLLPPTTRLPAHEQDHWPPGRHAHHPRRQPLPGHIENSSSAAATLRPLPARGSPRRPPTRWRYWSR